MDCWRTAIVKAVNGEIRVRGYDVTQLMRGASFTETVFVLHRGRPPARAEREMLDAVLTAVADHGSGAPSCAAARIAASGNRQGLSSAVAAGVLAVGDEHGGAGSTCMALIAEGLARARTRGEPLKAAAEQIVDEYRARHQRVPGLGHRLHTVDPRTPVLFEMARERGLAGDGIAFMEALAAAVASRVKPLPVNVDGALAGVLHDLGFAPPAGRLLFLIGRVAGLTAEVAEEIERERPMRVRVPVDYDGPPPRSWGS